MAASQLRLLLLFVLAVSVLPLFAEAQAYWVVYPSDCPNVCDAANPSSPYSGYPTCVSQCNSCLLYWGCYSSFYPYFSSVTASNGTSGASALAYTGYSCSCYWPWWAWTIMGVGIFIIVFICLPVCVVYFCCKGTMAFLNRNKGGEETVIVAQEAQPYVAQAYPAQAYPPPDAYGAPPPPDAYGMPPPPGKAP